MEAPAVHLTVCLFFLGTMVLLRMERDKMRREHAESFRNIAAGITILALVSVERLAHATGLLFLIPFISEPTFYELTTVIAAITGVILLVSGMSLWLPLGRTLRLYNKLRIRRLDLLRRVEQLVGVESRLTVILEKTLGYMIEQFGFDGGAVFVRSRRSRHMLLLGTCNVTEQLDETIRHATVTNSDHTDSAAHDLRVAVPDGAPQPSFLLPVEIRGRVAAAFALWCSRDAEPSDDDRVILKLACDALARRMRTETHRVEREFINATRARRDELRRHLSGPGTFEDKLAVIARVIGETIPAEICSFTISFDDSDTCRYTVGRPGSLLTEKGVERLAPRPNEEVGAPALIADLERHPDDPVVAMLHRAGMQTAVSLTLSTAADSVDRLVIGASAAYACTARDLEFLAALADLLRATIQAEVTRRRDERTDRRLKQAHEFVRSCNGYHLSSAAMFDEAARLIRDETGVAAVRIAMFEEDAAFIRSRAIAAAHPIDRAVPTDGYLIQALMPLHRRVRETGRTVTTADRGELRMSRGEAQQVYQADLRSALLVPISIAGEVRGVITLAERRRQSRHSFTTADQSYVEMIAAALALAVRLHETPWGALDEPALAEDAPAIRGNRRLLQAAVEDIRDDLTGMNSPERELIDIQ